eukprot:scaffold141386_cov21-Tisochrysis_lutea.AAC.2
MQCWGLQEKLKSLGEKMMTHHDQYCLPARRNCCSCSSQLPAEVTGQKFYYLRNAGALLELALVSWAMARVGAKGYTPFTTPDIVKAS